MLANFFTFFPLLVSSSGWQRTKLLRRFWLFLRLSAGVLSFSSSNLDSRISSFLELSDYSYFFIALLVMIANYFSILLIFTISMSIRFFFCPIFYNLMPLLSGMADIGAFLSLISGNFIVQATFLFCFKSFIRFLTRFFLICLILLLISYQSNFIYLNPLI